MLTESQRHIAGRFAMKGRISDRLLFEDIPYVRGEAPAHPWSAAPWPPWSAVRNSASTAGDHTLVIGRVLNGGLPSADGGPLTLFPGPLPAVGLKAAIASEPPGTNSAASDYHPHTVPV